MNKSDVLTVGSNEMELVDFRIFKEVGWCCSRRYLWGKCCKSKGNYKNS